MLQLFLSSPKPALRLAAVRTLNFVDVQVLSRSRLSYIFSNGGFDATKKMVRQKAIRLALTRMFVELCKFHRNKSKDGNDNETFNPDASDASGGGKIVSTFNELLSTKPTHVPGYDDARKVDPEKLEEWQHNTDKKLEGLSRQMTELTGLVKRMNGQDIVDIAEREVM